MKRIKRNSPAEEAAIQRGIAADLDAAEWTEEDFAQAHRAADVLSAEMLASLDASPPRPWDEAGEGAGNAPA